MNSLLFLKECVYTIIQDKICYNKPAILSKKCIYKDEISNNKANTVSKYAIWDTCKQFETKHPSDKQVPKIKFKRE